MGDKINTTEPGTFEWRMQHYELVWWLMRYEDIQPERRSADW